MKSELFQHEMQQTSGVFGRKKEVRVVFAGEGARTDGTTVTLPAIKQNNEVDELTQMVMRGYTDHEAGHVKHTDFKVIEALLNDKTIPDQHKPFIKDIANGIEDVWLERKVIADYPGSEKNLVATASEVNKLFHQEPSAEEVGKNWLRVAPAAITWEGRKGYDKIEGCEECLSKLEPKLRAKLTEWVGEIDNSKNSWDNMELAKKVFAEIYEEGESRQPDDGKGEPDDEGEEGNGDKEGDREGGKGDVEGEGTPNKDDPHGDEPTGGEGDLDGEGSDSTLEEGDDDEGTRSGSEDNTTDEEDEQSGGEGAQDTEEGDESDGTQEEGDGTPEDTGGQDVGDDDETSDEGDRGETKPDGDVDGESEEKATNEGGDIEVDVWKIPTWGEPDTVDTDLTQAVNAKLKTQDLVGNVKHDEYLIWTTEYDKEFDKKNKCIGDPNYIPVYEQAKEEMASELGVMQRKFMRSLVAKLERGWDDGRIFGRLDTRRLVSAYNGKEEVYRRKEESKELDTAVTLLIDCSGSMWRNEIYLAQSTAIAMVEALDRTGVKTEVLGFTNGSLPPKVFAEARGPVFGSRLCKLQHYIFKSFDDSLRDSRAGLGSITDQDMRSNVDGEAVFWAAQRLKRAQERRKVLFVLSDGMPAYPANRGMSPQNHLRYVTNEIVKEGLVECVGIGIMSDAVKQFYPKWHVIHSLDELSGTVMDQLSKMLLGQRFEIDNSKLLKASYGWVHGDKPPKLTIREEWMDWYPTRRWHMRFWVKVARAVKSRGVRHLDRSKIMPIIREMDNG